MKRSASAAPCPSGCGSSAKQARVRPCRLAVRAPVAAERPARQLFAGIPLALPHVHEAVRAVTLLQPAQQIRGARALGRPERGGVPLFRVAIGRRHERRLPAHRQADVAGGEVGVDRAPARENRLPLRVGVGLGDARRFDDPLHRHLVDEIDLARLRRRRRPARRSIGSGVHASGMCPSPASSPDVGSRPIQPAPGRYTSHQAWRSVKSRSAPAGPSSALTSGTSWIR